MREAFWWGLILAGLLLFAIALTWLAVPAAPASTQAPLCSDSPQQVEHMRSLLQRGLDDALVEHTKRLFRVWLASGVEGRERAAEGVRNEVRGYLYAQSVVDSWQIPACKPKR